MTIKKEVNQDFKKTTIIQTGKQFSYRVFVTENIYIFQSSRGSKALSFFFLSFIFFLYSFCNSNGIFYRREKKA